MTRTASFHIIHDEFRPTQGNENRLFTDEFFYCPNIHEGELELKSGIWKDDQVNHSLFLRKLLSVEWLYRSQEDKRSTGNKSKQRSVSIQIPGYLPRFIFFGNKDQWKI